VSNTRVCLLATLITMIVSGVASAMTVTLTPSLPAPASVGTTVTWTANVTGVTSGTIWYRFRARLFGQSYQVIQDFGPQATLDWTETNHEGWFEMEASAKNVATGQTTQASSMYEFV
jgi:hypothetical protein